MSARASSARYFGDILNRKSLPGIGFISVVNAADLSAAQAPAHLGENQTAQRPAAFTGAAGSRSQAGD